MIDYIKDTIKHIDEIIYPNTYIPLYQVISAFGIGLLFGSFHRAFIWSLISYLIFEFFLQLCTCNRPYMYVWQVRVIAIMFSIIGILFSKFIWGNRPLFQFFVR